MKMFQPFKKTFTAVKNRKKKKSWFLTIFLNVFRNATKFKECIYFASLTMLN